MRRVARRPAALVVASVAAITLATIAPGTTSSATIQSATIPVAPVTAGHHPVGAPGDWKVAATSRSAYRVTWTSPTRLPHSDARPEILVDGRWAGPASVSANGRRVSAVVASAQRPAAADVDVVLGGTILDQQSDGVTVPSPYQRPPLFTALADDPGVRGRHHVSTRTYALKPVKLPDIPALSEMVGHVVAPTDATNSSPLVVFLHGRHMACYTPAPHSTTVTVPIVAAPHAWACPDGEAPLPSYLGYNYVQRRLATQGYVTVSISADAVNDLDYLADDAGSAARAALIRHHLDAWATFVADGDEHADLDNVVLVGHSRGGEGANRASLRLSAVAGYTVTGQVLLGPTDFAFQAAPTTPTVTVLPYCDGDVSDLEGQNFTDDARDLALGLAFHSSILVMGANHNFFNTEWTPGTSVAPSMDDWSGSAGQTCAFDDPARLSAVQQRKVGSAYIAGAVRLFARDDQRVLPMFDGSATTVASAGNADVRSHAVGGGIDVRRPGLDLSIGDTDGAQLRLCTGLSDLGDPNSCEPFALSSYTPHWPSAAYPGVPSRSDFEMTWTASGQAAGVDLTKPWDLSDDSHLDLRTIVAPALGAATLDVRLVDGNGGSAVVTPDNGGKLLPLPDRGGLPPMRWGQTLRVPLDGLTGVDLSDIVTINLVAQTAGGRVWIVDMSSAPTHGITEPAGQTPLVSFGKVRRDEGDGPGDVTVQFPYRVTGALTRAATVNVTVFGAPGMPFLGPQRMRIPPHTTAGTFAITYTPNTTADKPERSITVIAYATRGIQTDNYVGRLVIVDDDATPTRWQPDAGERRHTS